jgi:hypothetical protein
MLVGEPLVSNARGLWQYHRGLVGRFVPLAQILD